ncbi:Protein kinase superfamily protein [Raphanus sativus]|uniref:Mitogen-activated protein kinase kinase kinase 20-like n=1 Tax=Raphanus sativus TaxID=3726 RepID=A0A6J0MNT3_RAPSA|nr:mitogen-activated protein kinase kinase kinase 20-like [Raphanus sativus]KAJ4907373.1 Protein kinase superfamily protein [Raphanus sativus]
MGGPDLWFVKHLGKGSFGSVSLYQGLRFDGTVIYVAVKTSDGQHAESLFREVQILSEFKGCPRIVQCYRVKAELNRFNGCVEYKIPLEYAPGGSLSGFINKFKDNKLPDPMIRDFTRMLLEGLATIHAHGYVHCDLKPENILVFPSYVNNNGAWSSSFELKISDFGLSRREVDSSWWSPSRPFAGTSIYMSPDSVSYGETGKDLDLWSLGCCVLEMYTGKGPWWHKNYEVDDLMKGQQPPIPSELPFEAKLFIMTCFAPRTKDATRLLKHIFVRGDEGTQPSHDVSDKIDLQLANNFVRRNVSKTQSIRVPPAAAQVMPNKTIMA